MSSILSENITSQLQDAGSLVQTGAVENGQYKSSENQFRQDVNAAIQAKAQAEGKTVGEVQQELSQKNAIAEVFLDDTTEQQDVDLSGIKNGQAAIATGQPADKIVGIGGSDIIASGAGDDTVSGNKGNDNIDGGAGNDIIFGYKGTVAADGTITLDSASASPDNDTIDGGSGRDQIFGQQGNDYLIGGGGADTIDGGTGNDLIYGDYADPGLISSRTDQGADSISGGAGDDTIYGGKGADTIDGGEGDDVIVGGSGVDQLTGGAGADTFVFNQLNVQASPDTVTDFEQGVDKIRLTGFGSNPTVSYDQATGELTVNGIVRADFGDNTDFNLTEDDWEIL